MTSTSLIAGRCLVGIVFSKDRALQLRALLDSLDRHCLDPEALQVLHVLYTGSTAELIEQYARLEATWRGRFPVVFHREQDFRRDLLRVLGVRDKPAWRMPSICDRPVWRASVGRIARRLRRLASRRQLPVPSGRAPWDYLLFLVDDNLFVRPFSFGTVMGALQRHPRAVGFSLRLGRNAIRCYTRSISQRLPRLEPAGPDVLVFEWPGEEGDFGYPLEVSSSVYPREVIAGLLGVLRYTSPNTLESQLAGAVFDYDLPRWRPQLCCPPVSVAFCAPVNRVQDAYPNRVGESGKLTAAELARRFDEGLRIEVEALDDFVPDACHCEVPLRFVATGSGD
jgi:hypothetical protein